MLHLSDRKQSLQGMTKKNLKPWPAPHLRAWSTLSSMSSGRRSSRNCSATGNSTAGSSFRSDCSLVNFVINFTCFSTFSRQFFVRSCSASSLPWLSAISTRLARQALTVDNTQGHLATAWRYLLTRWTRTATTLLFDTSMFVEQPWSQSWRHIARCLWFRFLDAPAPPRERSAPRATAPQHLLQLAAVLVEHLIHAQLPHVVGLAHQRAPLLGLALGVQCKRGHGGLVARHHVLGHDVPGARVDRVAQVAQGQEQHLRGLVRGAADQAAAAGVQQVGAEGAAPQLTEITEIHFAMLGACQEGLRSCSGEERLLHGLPLWGCVTCRTPISVPCAVCESHGVNMRGTRVLWPSGVWHRNAILTRSRRARSPVSIQLCQALAETPSDAADVLAGIHELADPGPSLLRAGCSCLLFHLHPTGIRSIHSSF